MEDGLGAANTRRAMSRRVERVERGVPGHDETLMRLASMHAIGATTAQRWAARQPVHAWRVCYNWTQPQPGSDGMKVLLTGGAGDLGTVLTPLLEARGDTPLRLDIVPPTDPGGVSVAGSIVDRDGLARWLAGMDSVVHIAAWHGIHETTGAKDVYAFWDLNVTGTMNVFEAAHRAGVTQVVYLSSTSVRNHASLYGQTKVLGEAIAQTYRTRHGMQGVILRPRGFIPHWNRAVYASFVAWLAWFWRGAVHIEDVAHAVVGSLDRLATSAEASRCRSRRNWHRPNALRSSGSCVSVGICASSVSTGITRTPAAKASTSSRRVQSATSSIQRPPPEPAAASHRVLITASTTRACRTRSSSCST